MKKAQTTTHLRSDHQSDEGAEQLKSKYLRALADYQNLEKRMRDEWSERDKYASARIVKELLPVVDNLERACVHISDEGLTHVLRQLNTILSGNGVRKLDVVGKHFNPHEMECVGVIEGKDGIVLKETTPGYCMNERILRPASVIVGRIQSDNTTVQENSEHIGNKS